MTENEKLLALCRSCINSLNTAINADLPNSTMLQIKQNLFMLEAAMQDFSTAQNPDFAHPASNVAGASNIHSELPSNLKEASVEFEKQIILKAIDLYGSKRKAAKALNLDHSTLVKKCQRYGI